MAKIFLLTGLSGAGKTTLSKMTRELLGNSCKFVILDGDEMRHGVNSDLGFSPQDRKENIRRCAEFSKLLAGQGINVFIAVIAPYRHLREKLENIVGAANLRTIHVSCNMEECIRRDPKKNYKKALAGELKNYTGIGDTYEQPESPHLVLHTDCQSATECASILHDFVLDELEKEENESA